MKKGFVIWAVFGLIFLLMVGCGKKNQVIRESGTPLQFIILDEDEIPEKLQEKIEEEKKKPFQLGFSDGKDLYLVIGYGEQETGGYSIKVHAVEQVNNTIRVITELIPPKKGEAVVQVLSYPYIVLRTKDIQLPIEFETIP
ncbi:MAG: protease complex subunit PrcB family protein [Epulopiscium sp.]|nr:protease complex subunit PrcB family protein [Candidatus Epulonipiscium sp.]